MTTVTTAMTIPLFLAEEADLVLPLPAQQIRWIAAALVAVAVVVAIVIVMRRHRRG